MRATSRTGPWPPSRARGGETRQTPGSSIRSDAIRQSGLGKLDMRAFLMCVPFALGQRSGEVDCCSGRVSGETLLSLHGLNENRARRRWPSELERWLVLCLERCS